MYFYRRETSINWYRLFCYTIILRRFFYLWCFYCSGTWAVAFFFFEGESKLSCGLPVDVNFSFEESFDSCFFSSGSSLIVLLATSSPESSESSMTFFFLLAPLMNFLSNSLMSLSKSLIAFNSDMVLF